MRRRPPSVTYAEPGAATRILGALGLKPDHPRLSEQARAQLLRIEAGAPLTRPELARLKKRLLAALLEERVDHRAGAYRAAKSAVMLAVRRGAERAGGEQPRRPERERRI